jgi:GrpB-like predicted nucleotidyltransferase (UPF0157 family)
MSRKTIRVVGHDEGWGEEFRREAARLQDALGSVLLDAHHIGSTAVPGLAAKPVIDILLEVESLEALDDRERALVALGYRPKGENGIAGRRYFQRGDRDRTHQVHAYVRGDGHIRRHIAFRDYLRTHAAVAEEYARIKRHAAEACAGDSEVYCDMKDGFIKTHERLALLAQG